jgi:hypothetical protein
MKRTLLATAIILALAATPTVFAKGKPPPQEETGNNLSFATKFVPNAANAPALRLDCSATPTSPSGPYCTQYPGYWCQKTLAEWQAACIEGGGTTTVTAVWGSNLLGDAPLKAGRPIRVEMVLTESGGSAGKGYIVTKLTPELEDSLATYGTDGAEQNTDYVVFDDGAQLKIEACVDTSCSSTTGNAIYDGAFSAEINSLGKVVYGYNWGTAGKASAAQPGIYKLTFTANGTTIDSAPGAQVCTVGNCTFVIINVTQSSGGGGGPPNRP